MFFFSFKWAPSLSVALQWSVIQNSENSLKECVFFCTEALSENVGVGGMCLYESFWKGFETDQRRLKLLVIKCVCSMRLLVWRVVNKTFQFRLTFLILSCWEMISGFKLTVTSREKRQGMKLCSGLRTICESTWPDQSHAWKWARKLNPTFGSLCLQFLRHSTWMTLLLLFVEISMLFTGESNYVFSSVAFQIQKNRNYY